MKEYEKVTKSYETEEVSKVNCDKCGKKIDLKGRKEKYINLDFGIRNAVDIDINKPHYQLCNNCARVFWNWFDYKLENEEHYKVDWDWFLDPDYDFDEE
jgi:DNA-directed RNA polymerase subunit RPC12/RpoP